MMLVDTAQFFLDYLAQPYIALLLLRFHMQWLHAPLRNPLGEFVILLTDPLVRPARRLIPSIRLLDMATLLLAFILELLYLSAILLLHQHPLNALILSAWALLELFKISIYLLVFALFMEALLSWTNPHAPFAPVLSSITSPFLRPLRRMVPQTGSLDFSFLILFFLCYIILKLPLGWLEGLILRAL
jgi:YggT family protein